MKSPFVPKQPDREIREHPRLHMKALHNISMQFEKNEMHYRVTNVSAGGLGFFSEKTSHLSDKQKISIFLNIDNRPYEVQIEIVHLGSETTGCKFIKPPSELIQAIEKYFQTELAALKVNRIETKNEESVGGMTVYFRGQNNCELLINEIDNKLLNFSIILFGNYIEGDGKGHFCLGQKIEDGVIPLPNGVQLFRPMPSGDRHLIESSMRFVSNIQDLSEIRKTVLLDILAKAVPTEGKKII